uniref:Uncharacterized protein n=1 Tax=Anguilla anguilla TaxID=7936 RepID=A0A0E9QQW0_ANGAN
MTKKRTERHISTSKHLIYSKIYSLLPLFRFFLYSGI